MSPERVERRLAAILAANVAGYSRLMGIDEQDTLARLKAHLAELIDAKITEHRGRVVNLELLDYTSRPVIAFDLAQRS
ncbi:MAG TPA: hypothetical protein VLX09_15845 [Stellaceae bacterium]|nr:hypothetical protein [Stellaceae bacterium]